MEKLSGAFRMNHIIKVGAEMKRMILFITICLCGMFVIAAPGEKYYFSGLSLKDGLSQVSVLKIYQDSKGYMWFATRNGLNRYDGEKFRVYRHIHSDSSSIADNHITALVEDSKGNLWVGTMNGLSRIDLKNNQIHTYHTNNTSFSLSDDNILSLYEDDKRRLWVGTGNGISLYIPEYDAFQPIDLNGILANEGVNVIMQDSQKRFLIGTARKGMIVSSPDMKYMRSFTDTTHVPLTGNTVTAIYEDSRRQLWIGTNSKGITRLDIDRSEATAYTKQNSDLLDNNIRCFVEQNGKLIVGTFAGLGLFDLEKEVFSQYRGYSLREGGLSHFSIYSTYVDRAGTLWVGTYAGGINYYNPCNKRFVFYNPVFKTNSLFGIYGTMVHMPDGNLWIATEGGGLLRYDVAEEKFDYYLLENNLEIVNNRNIIKSLMPDGNILWCGTNNGHIYHFDIKKRTFRSFYQFPKECGIYVINRDSLGNIWAGATDDTGLVCFSPDGKIHDRFRLADSSSVALKNIRCFLELRKRVYLVGTRSSGLMKLDLEAGKITYYNTEQDSISRLRNNYVSFLMRDSHRRVWVGTFGGGLYQYDEKAGLVRNIDMQQGLTDDNICSLVESPAHTLWIGTSSGLCEYDPASGVISGYNSPSEIQVREFTPGGVAVTSDGRLYFSGTNGILAFYPDHLIKNTFMPPVVLKDLVVNNKAIVPGDETGILAFSLDASPQVDLEHDQNNLSISYGALNYIYPEQNRYAYRLVGYDKDWVYAGDRKEAFYTNLNPGKYVFEVIASNNDGVWNKEGKKVHLVIHASIWRNPVAYSLYGLAVLLVFVLITYYRHVKRRLEQDLKIKQFEQQKQEEFHQAKIRMFTNFSHELRTPLTLIINPLDDIIKRVDLSEGIRNSLKLVNANAQRLLLLVNQLMDLRKNQSGAMQLKVSEENLYPFVQEIFFAFKQIADSRKVIFNFEAEKKRMDGWVDRSLFEKVVFNLLSNALKYTSEGEQIILRLEARTEEEVRRAFGDRVKGVASAVKYIVMQVEDGGQGIPEAELEHVFAPFYQVERDQEGHIAGTGIGLSLTQAVVNLHHGTVWAETNSPKGVRFCVVIPADKSLYTPVQLKEPEPASLPETPMEFVPVSESGKKRYTLLLVEDNREIRQYMREYFERYYRVVEAGNGMDGFEKITGEMPDLVVSDIMMPKMDGLELCALIKKDMRTGHIPVILLTARSMVVQMKDGFQAGADDYVIKPFNIDLLHCRIEALLAQREKLRELYGKKFSAEAMGIEIHSADDHFMQKFFEVIEKNVSNPELNVDILCEGVGLSRTNLYRKLKAVTELSPVELIKNKRMEIAMKLMETTDMTVSEISFQVGFNSPAYFTNNFKTTYGQTPKEYIMGRKKAETL